MFLSSLSREEGELCCMSDYYIRTIVGDVDAVLCLPREPRGGKLGDVKHTMSVLFMSNALAQEPWRWLGCLSSPFHKGGMVCTCLCPHEWDTDIKFPRCKGTLEYLLPAKVLVGQMQVISITQVHLSMLMWCSL